VFASYPHPDDQGLAVAAKGAVNGVFASYPRPDDQGLAEP